MTRRILTDEQKQALANTPITEINRYMKAGKNLPETLCRVGVETLFDLFTADIAQLSEKPKGFSEKKCRALQNAFRGLSDDKFDDIVFWSKRRLFPANYCSKKDVLESVEDVLNELCGYFNECAEHKNYRTRNELKKIGQLQVAINDLHDNEKSSVRGIAEQLNKTRERVRQAAKVEFLNPLFNGEEVPELFRNIGVDSRLVEQVKGCIFGYYPLSHPEPSRFAQLALNIDSVTLYNLGHIVVPSGSKGCYERVYTATIDELTSIMKPIVIEALLDRIRCNHKVVKKVINAGKEYSDDFIYALIYSTGLVDIDEYGRVLIRPEYIRDSQNGVIKEKAMARIIADAERPLMRQEVYEEFGHRYGFEKEMNVTTTKKYGCSCVGGNRWVYGQNELPFLGDWVEEYALNHQIFNFDEIHQAVIQAGHVVSNLNTLRTYITNCCAVDMDNKEHFCHKRFKAQHAEFRWSDSPRRGIVNWIANELHLYLQEVGKDRISIKEANKLLFERGQMEPEYREDVEYGYSTLISTSLLTSGDCSPFVIEPAQRGDWYIAKNKAVYDSIDWANFGKRGRLNDRKLLVLATAFVRKNSNFSVLLMDLVDELYENGDFEGWARMQIRKKLISAINDMTNSRNMLKLTKIDGRNYVSIDARKCNTMPKPIRSVYDWGVLKPLLYSELSFCEEWLQENYLGSYDEAFERFERVIMHSSNKNLCKVFPKKLYEFFCVKELTEDDKYLIMCSIAKNFEALLKDIHLLNDKQTQQDAKNHINGLFDVTLQCGFREFNDVLDEKTKIQNLRAGSYQKTLKYLSRVRNTDAHGQWYVDEWWGDTRSEVEKNTEKIKLFAALYIFAVAKYLD